MFSPGNPPATSRSGFTLVEVIIVTLLLGVLLSGVWSMFQMQQRMLEQGDRLSRESTEIRMLWQNLRDDLSRIQMPGPPRQATQRQGPQRPAENSDSTTASADGFDAMDSTLAVALPAADSTQDSLSRQQPLRELEFVLEGEADWLVFDTRRPFQQWPGLKPTTTSESRSVSSDTFASPSPYQRVMYVWLTTEEVNQWLQVELADGPLQEDIDTSESTNGNLTSTVLDSQADPAPRWLFRFSCDWNRVVESTDSPLTNLETTTSDSSTEVDQRREDWLQWFLQQPQSAYVSFQSWQGNLTLATSFQTDDIATDEPSEAAQHWISASESVAIDWIPSMVDGQFQYYTRLGWRSSLTSSDLGRNPVLAIECQFNCRPNHTPVAVASTDSSDTLLPYEEQNSLQSLDGFETLEDPVEGWSEQLASEETSPFRQPQYEHACLISLHGQVSRQVQPESASNARPPNFDNEFSDSGVEDLP